MPLFFGLKLTTQMSEQVGIEVNCLAHIIERTGLVTSLHTKRTTKLIDFDIFRMESINKGVEIFFSFLILLHLAEGDGTLLVSLGIGGVGGNGLSGLSNDFKWGHGENLQFDNLQFYY